MYVVVALFKENLIFAFFQYFPETMSTDELLSLMTQFTPSEFTEDNFVNLPPLCIIEKTDGQDLIIVAKNSRSMRLLEELSYKNYVRKLRQDLYIIDRLSMINALTKFLWIIRISWKNEEVYLLWALINSLLKTSDPESLKLTLFKEFNIELDKCLSKVNINSTQEYSRLLELLLSKLDQQLSRIPPVLLQKIIDYLCVHGELTVEELSTRFIREGVSINTLYKALSRLKKENYVRVAKHVRISSRGPMRELLASNCNKCLYNYSSHDTCYKSSLNQLSAILYVFYNKSLTSRDLEKLCIEFKSIPYPQRVIKRINDILISLSVIRSRLEDKLTSSILHRIQAATGVNIV
jgi:DNA-binding transcriptional ArsR family regulator